MTAPEGAAETPSPRPDDAPGPAAQESDATRSASAVDADSGSLTDAIGEGSASRSDQGAPFGEGSGSRSDEGAPMGEGSGSRSDEGAPFGEGSGSRSEEGAPFGEDVSEPSWELEVSSSRGDADDDVHFGVAARALGVSRKTVERMVKRGQLERGPSGAPATVSKRALVAVLETRRRDVIRLSQAAADDDQHPGDEGVTGSWPDPHTREFQELVTPLLRPLLDELDAARARAAVLERKLESVVAASAADDRAREDLLRALAMGGWRQRRKARKAAIRRYVRQNERRS